MTQTQDTDVLASLREILGRTDAGRAFGPPVTQGGTIVLPVAKVGSGGGGGGGTGPGDDRHQQTGTGAGFGLTAKALGVYVLRDGDVRWLPAVDVTRIVLGGQLVAAAGILVAGAVLRSRTAARQRRTAAKLTALGRIRRRKH